MSKRTEPSVSDRVQDVFRRAGATEADLEWADAAITCLVWARVKDPYAELVLGIAADTLEQARASAEDVFGPAGDWAEEQVRWLQAEGLDAIDHPDGPVPVPAMVDNGHWLATWFSLLLVLNALFKLLTGSNPLPFSLTTALLPALLALCCTATYGTFSALRPRRRFALAVAAGVVALSISAAVTAVVLVLVHDVGPQRPWPWTLLLVPFHGLLAWSVSSVASGHQPSGLDPRRLLQPETVTADEWSRRLQAALRTRDDLSEAKIDSVVAETRQHLTQARTEATDEFGSPEGYANTVRADPAVRPRRKTAFWAALCGLWLLLLVGELAEHGLDFSWLLVGYAFVVVMTGWSALGQARAWRRAAQGAGPDQTG